MTLSARLFIFDALRIRVLTLLLAANYDKLLGLNALVLFLHLQCRDSQLERLLFSKQGLRRRFLGHNLAQPGPRTLVAGWG